MIIHKLSIWDKERERFLNKTETEKLLSSLLWNNSSYEWTLDPIEETKRYEYAIKGKPKQEE